MSDVTNVDPKFIPSAALLKTVGLTQADVANNDVAFKFIEDAITDIATKDYQISVTIYILRVRGVGNDVLAPRFGWTPGTIDRKFIEGMAILRTGETAKTVNAVRVGNLSKTLVNEITTNGKSKGEKIAMLKEAAVGTKTQSDYVNPDGKPVTEAQIAQVLALTPALAEEAAKPDTAESLISLIPSISEKVGLVKKEVKRTPQNQGEAGPFTLEYHFKAALKDARAIVKASDDEAYVITQADAKAMLELLKYVGVNAETLTAIEVLTA